MNYPIYVLLKQLIHGNYAREINITPATIQNIPMSLYIPMDSEKKKYPHESTNTKLRAVNIYAVLISTLERILNHTSVLII